MSDLKKFDGEIVTLEEMAEIEESSEVVNVESNGSSGQHVGYYWYTVTFADGSEMDVYCK